MARDVKDSFFFQHVFFFFSFGTLLILTLLAVQLVQISVSAVHQHGTLGSRHVSRLQTLWTEHFLTSRSELVADMRNTQYRYTSILSQRSPSV